MSEPIETAQFTDALSALVATVATSGARECPCEPCGRVSAALAELYQAARAHPVCV